jgi:hypothetical protein
VTVCFLPCNATCTWPSKSLSYSISFSTNFLICIFLHYTIL